jgi:hypothetical protein
MNVDEEVKQEVLIDDSTQTDANNSNDIVANNTTNNEPLVQQAIKQLEFYEHFTGVKKMQQNILYQTGMAKEKIKYANEVSVSHLKTFKEESEKYGKYLKQIHQELGMVQDLIK